MASPIQVGFHDQRRCNRILKPPGGGTSDIFGTDRIVREIKVDQKLPEDKKPEPQSNPEPPIVEEPTPNDEPSSENAPQNGNEAIENGASHENGESKVEDVKIEELKIEDGGREEVHVQKSSFSAEYKTSSISNILRQEGAVIDATTPIKKITPNKNRVPPGGYSSGLW